MQELTISLLEYEPTESIISRLESIKSSSCLLSTEIENSTSMLIDQIILSYYFEDDDDSDRFINLIKQRKDHNGTKQILINKFKKFSFDFENENYSNFKLLQQSLPFCKSFESQC